MNVRLNQTHSLRSIGVSMLQSRAIANLSMSLNRRLAPLFITAIAGCAQQLMPTPNIYDGSERDCFDEVALKYRTNHVEVVYVTDRLSEPRRDGLLAYGSERSDALSYGICTVAIGRDLSWADLVHDSRTRHRRNALNLSCQSIRELGHLPKTPLALVMRNGELVDDPDALGAVAAAKEEFCDFVSQRLSEAGGKKEAYVYVHGFNNTFEDAAFVMAGLWHFLGRQGIPFIYTWPAGGGGYGYDRESGEFTIYHLKQFLRGLASCPDVEKIHLIAHSRGTDVALTALRELQIENRGAGSEGSAALKLGNLVLAAADLDLQVVRQRIVAERLMLLPECLTVYTSDDDMAISAAEILFRSTRRLGELRASDLTPEQKANLAAVPQMQIIQCRVTNSLLGHDYFHSNPAVSSDLILLLRDGREPGVEHGRPLIKHFRNFWEIRDGYPTQEKD